MGAEMGCGNMITPGEAIRFLNEGMIIRSARSNGNLLSDMVREKAVEALEKQIAKELGEKTINNVKYPICPVCGRVLWGKEYYCATCGQRVNRGEQE